MPDIRIDKGRAERLAATVLREELGLESEGQRTRLQNRGRLSASMLDPTKPGLRGYRGPQVGFIAEDVQQVDPRPIVLDASGTQSAAFVGEPRACRNIPSQMTFRVQILRNDSACKNTGMVEA